MAPSSRSPDRIRAPPEAPHFVVIRPTTLVTTTAAPNPEHVRHRTNWAATARPQEIAAQRPREKILRKMSVLWYIASPRQCAIRRFVAGIHRSTLAAGPSAPPVPTDGCFHPMFGN